MKERFEIARMVLASTVVLAIALTLAHSISAASQGQGGVPKLTLESARHDFGEVFAGEDLSHVFLVRNSGSVPLELSDSPQLGTRPSKVFFPNPRGGMKTTSLAKIRSAAPS